MAMTMLGDVHFNLQDQKEPHPQVSRPLTQFSDSDSDERKRKRAGGKHKDAMEGATSIVDHHAYIDVWAAATTGGAHGWRREWRVAGVGPRLRAQMPIVPCGN